MQRRLLCGLGFLALVSAPFPVVEAVTALAKIKFPYSPISSESATNHNGEANEKTTLPAAV